MCFSTMSPTPSFVPAPPGSDRTIYGELMIVTLMYFDGCPNWKTADERLTQLSEEITDMTLERRVVGTSEDAERYEFRGSPSILVDGVDAFAAPDAPVGLSCRVYPTPDGPAGSPTIEQLRQVLAV